jgi:hypothetical protein
MKQMRMITALVFAAALAGCASDDENEGTDPGTFATADYTMTANSVEDNCIDGAATAIAIPDASGTREFTNTLGFPGSGDATFTTKLKLVEPFSEVDVTFTSSGTNAWVWDRPKNPGVDLGKLDANYQGCTADFEFGGEWTAESLADGTVRFDGSTSFIITATNGDAACPTLQATPCTIKLGMIASK